MGASNGQSRLLQGQGSLSGPRVLSDEDGSDAHHGEIMRQCTHADYSELC